MAENESKTDEKAEPSADKKAPEELADADLDQAGGAEPLSFRRTSLISTDDGTSEAKHTEIAKGIIDSIGR